MHLVGFEHHQVLLLEFHHHRHMVEVAIREESLHLSPEVLCIKQKDIASVCVFQEFSLSERVLVIIDKLVHGLQHQLVLLHVVSQHLRQ